MHRLLVALGVVGLSHGWTGRRHTHDEVDGTTAHYVAASCQPEVGVEYVGGNLFDKLHPNRSETGPGGCCELCKRERDCQLFTYSPTCWENLTGCCWLKRRHGAVRNSRPNAVSGTLGDKPLPGWRYRCVDTQCVRDPTGRFTSVTCNATCEAGDADDDNGRPSRLVPVKFGMLPLGAVAPTGWLRDQLVVQLKGLSGHLGRFWPDVANSTWIFPESLWHETYSDRGGNLPYWLNGVIPLVFQLREDADRVDSSADGNLTHFVVNYMRSLLANQLATNPPAMYSWWSLGTWNVIRSMHLYLSANPTEVPAFLPFILGYINAAQVHLAATGWPDGGSACTQCDQYHPSCAAVVPGSGSHCIVRYPEWMWILQQLHDAPYLQDNATARRGVLAHMRLVGEWGTDFQQAYAHPCDLSTNRSGLPNCFPTTGCNHERAANGCKGYPLPAPQATHYFAHGVSGVAMPLKEGAVRWRMTERQDHWELSYLKLALLDQYHAQPTGGFSADEYLAGRHPSRGVELCTIVETLYSLCVMHRIQGDVAFMDRAEKIAYNALPAALTGDMWGHNYLSTINEIQAVQSDPHLFGDTDNATIYGLADRFTGVTPCCTANFNQGWPKLTMNTVTVTPGPNADIVVSLFAPVVARLPFAVAGEGAFVEVVTAYPFGDVVVVTVAATTRPITLRLRIPGWATAATVSVKGGVAGPVVPMQFLRVDCGAGNTTVTLALNPEIRVETGWGEVGYNSAVVTRGPLLFALGLDENARLLHPPWACFESGCSTDRAFSSTEPWAFALALPPSVEGRPSTHAMRFRRAGLPNTVPFETGMSPVSITTLARRVANWTMDADFPFSAQHPPESPMACADNVQCGPVVNITLVPFGATRLRVETQFVIQLRALIDCRLKKYLKRIGDRQSDQHYCLSYTLAIGLKVIGGRTELLVNGLYYGRKRCVYLARMIKSSLAAVAFVDLATFYESHYMNACGFTWEQGTSQVPLDCKSKSSY